MGSAAIGSKKGQPNTWDGVLVAARKAGAKFPELVAAQWALESGWGEHTSGKHNYFGLKGSGSDVATQEFLNGQWVTIRAGFIDFPDLGACVEYLVTRWYKDWQKFQGVNRASTREAAAKELVAQGYATDPAYAEKLIRIMKEKAPAQQEVVPPRSKPVLFRLVAGQDTWLKKEPVAAAGLGGDKKVAVSKGRVYAVCAYRECPGDAHAQVELAGGAGTWFVFEPHWSKAQASGEALPAAVDWGDFGALVTPNLTVGEILQWDRRRAPASDAVKRTLVNTAKQFQAIRSAWGKPLGVTSFYRPEPINRQVGGVPGSRHTTGEAFDLYPVKGSLDEFYRWLRPRWSGGLGDGRPRGFVHCDTRNGGGFKASGGVRPAVEWDY